MSAANTYSPRGLQAAGRRLWKAVTEEYELQEHERVLLLEACGTADVCARLSATAADHHSPSPVLTELRQQRLVLAKLVTALRLPAGLSDEPPSAGPVRKRAASLRRSS